MITTVALNAYNLDSYPEASGEVSSWINFSRTVRALLFDEKCTRLTFADWRLHRELFSGHLGEFGRDEIELWHTGCDLFCGCSVGDCAFGIWEEVEVEEWTVEFCYCLRLEFSADNYFLQ